ncbi:MAG: hypothetical protein SH848_14815 [Saprospiraceae bacterium]|nr:hypothetical protein [Saprospiraceae bacterium]MDZ4705196.1 hypothetical protein [Saprospiraceae bacterium]
MHTIHSRRPGRYRDAQGFDLWGGIYLCFVYFLPQCIKNADLNGSVETAKLEVEEIGGGVG